LFPNGQSSDISFKDTYFFSTHKNERNDHLTGFPAMLAAECLIDIPLMAAVNHEHNRALEYTISFLSLPSDITGLSNTEYPSRKPWTLYEPSR
jgi:hypothetical protein